MKAPKYVVFAVAAVAAVLLALVAKGLLAGKPTTSADATQVKVSQTPQIPMIKVLVAARPIKAGERLDEGDMIWMDWPESAKSPTYRIKSDGPEVTPAVPLPANISGEVQKMGKTAGDLTQKVLDPIGGMQDFIGGVVRENFEANEPIIDAKIVRANEGGFMAVMLEPGLRAVAIPISVENTAGGFILPGDHVDIMVSHEVPRPGGQGGNMFVANTVLSNVKVLAVDQSSDIKKDQQTVVGATATLAVSPSQGRALAQAKSMGSLSLMLRSYADVNEPTNRVITTEQNTRQNSVRVFRDGASTEVLVNR